MKTYLLLAALALAQMLFAQTANDPNRLILQTTSSFFGATAGQHADRHIRQFADYFMRKATLIDASGAILIGRDRILTWRDDQAHLTRPAASRPEKIQSSLIRLLRPDLAIVVAQTRVGVEQPANDLSYNILWRRIDGKWYIESCTITPVVKQFDTASAVLAPE